MGGMRFTERSRSPTSFVSTWPEAWRGRGSGREPRSKHYGYGLRYRSAASGSVQWRARELSSLRICLKCVPSGHVPFRSLHGSGVFERGVAPARFGRHAGVTREERQQSRSADGVRASTCQMVVSSSRNCRAARARRRRKSAAAWSVSRRSSRTPATELRSSVIDHDGSRLAVSVTHAGASVTRAPRVPVMSTAAANSPAATRAKCQYATVRQRPSVTAAQPPGVRRVPCLRKRLKEVAPGHQPTVGLLQFRTFVGRSRTPGASVGCSLWNKRGRIGENHGKPVGQGHAGPSSSFDYSALRCGMWCGRTSLRRRRETTSVVSWWRVVVRVAWNAPLTAARDRVGNCPSPVQQLTGVPAVSAAGKSPDRQLAARARAGTSQAAVPRRHHQRSHQSGNRFRRIIRSGPPSSPGPRHVHRGSPVASLGQGNVVYARPALRTHPVAWESTGSPGDAGSLVTARSGKRIKPCAGVEGGVYNSCPARSSAQICTTSFETTAKRRRRHPPAATKRSSFGAIIAPFFSKALDAKTPRSARTQLRKYAGKRRKPPMEKAAAPTKKKRGCRRFRARRITPQRDGSKLRSGITVQRSVNTGTFSFRPIPRRRALRCRERSDADSGRSPSVNIETFAAAVRRRGFCPHRPR